MNRTVLVVVHTGREENLRTAERATEGLLAAGMRPRVLSREAADLKLDDAVEVIDAGVHAADGVEVIIVLGGDGTLLRAAELARPTGSPVLGVNLGRIGFLAEVDHDELDAAVRAVVLRQYKIDERMTIDVRASYNGTELASTWALNEVNV